MTVVKTLTTIRFPSPTPRSRLERLLAHFIDVRAGEGANALLFALNLCLLLASYYMLKTAREALILTQGGAEVKSYSAAGQAVLLLAILPAYGSFASKVSRVRLLTGAMLFFVSNLLLCIGFGSIGTREGVAFFLWVGVFNVLVVSQVWAFANDLYTRSAGERLFPLLGLGGSLGAWLGAVAAGRLVRVAGPYGLMTAGAILLTICTLLTAWIDRRHRGVRNSPGAKAAEKPLGNAGGFQLVLRDRYLLSIAVFVVLLNVINSSGEFLLSRLVISEAAHAFPAQAMTAARARFVGEFYASFFAWVNLLGLALQAFFVSRIFKAIRPSGALFIGPAIALIGYSVILVAPLLALVRVLKIIDNSNDYSVQNTARQALFLPVSREAKYKAKATIDSFCWRLGDVLQAGVVYGGTAMGFALSGFAALNIAFASAWICVAAKLARDYVRQRERAIDDRQTPAAGVSESELVITPD